MTSRRRAAPDGGFSTPRDTDGGSVQRYYLSISELRVMLKPESFTSMRDMLDEDMREQISTPAKTNAILRGENVDNTLSTFIFCLPQVYWASAVSEMSLNELAEIIRDIGYDFKNRKARGLGKAIAQIRGTTFAEWIRFFTDISEDDCVMGMLSGVSPDRNNARLLTRDLLDNLVNRYAINKAEEDEDEYDDEPEYWMNVLFNALGHNPPEDAIRRRADGTTVFERNAIPDIRDWFTHPLSSFPYIIAVIVEDMLEYGMTVNEEWITILKETRMSHKRRFLDFMRDYQNRPPQSANLEIVANLLQQLETSREIDTKCEFLRSAIQVGRYDLFDILMSNPRTNRIFGSNGLLIPEMQEITPHPTARLPCTWPENITSLMHLRRGQHEPWERVVACLMQFLPTSEVIPEMEDPVDIAESIRGCGRRCVRGHRFMCYDRTAPLTISCPLCRALVAPKEFFYILAPNA